MAEVVSRRRNLRLPEGLDHLIEQPGALIGVDEGVGGGVEKYELLGKRQQVHAYADLPLENGVDGANGGVVSGQYVGGSSTDLLCEFAGIGKH